MVGRLNFPDVCEEDPLGMSCRVDRGLDSPDSGLPPSPSVWLMHQDKPARGVSPIPTDEGSRVSALPSGPFQPWSYGEGIAIEPLPPKEVRYTSSMHYDSDRHFIQNVDLQPWGQGLEHCTQTITVLSHSTWRHYKTQLDFQPRHRPQSFTSTTIIYPKKMSAKYVTELSYDRHRQARRFLSSVELLAAGSYLSKTEKVISRSPVL
ncbi:refilin B [Syngnathus acus]|uniref:refilin B n=1 Tax=Syngnathus acus TaxID=161584 RepID=UPI001885E0B6|nr:refilin B [Syngnathus acus]